MAYSACYAASCFCTATCGDGIVLEGVESCETDDTKTCTSTKGYSGITTCNDACNGFDIGGSRCADHRDLDGLSPVSR